MDAGANPGAKISIYKRAEENENFLAKMAKATGLTEKEISEGFSDFFNQANENILIQRKKALSESLDEFLTKATEINKPAVNDDGEEKISEKIPDFPEDEPKKKVDEKFKEVTKNETEEKIVNEDLRKKLDAVQLAAIESIEKSCGVHIRLEPSGTLDVEAKNEPENNSSIVEKNIEKRAEEKSDLTQALAQVIKNLQGQIEKAADKEFVEFAKKYEILGLKSEELAPMLKQAKRENPALYESAISVIDGAVAAVEQSKVFSEVGKLSRGFIGDLKSQVKKFLLIFAKMIVITNQYINFLDKILNFAQDFFI